MRTSRFKFLFLALLISILASVIIPLCPAEMAKAEAAPQALRVGFFEFSGYHIKDETTGNLSGYGYDALQLISRYTDWTYEYKFYDKTYDECLTALQNGEIDILTSVSKTEEREKLFLFSDADIGTNSTIFTVKAGNGDVVKGEYNTYNGLKIGMLEVNSKNKVFEDWADGKFEFIRVYKETEAELSAALASGEIDGIVSGSLRDLNNEWLIESLSPSPFYICVSRDKQDLMDKINVAIEKLDTDKPAWRDDLRKKYYSTDETGNIVFSPEEREYIRDLRNSDNKITVLMNPDRTPYSYFDENGVAQGILPAMFNKMVEGLKLNFEFVYTKDRADYYDKRNAKNYDVVLDFLDDNYLAETNGYKITDCYYSTTHTLLKNRELKGAPKVFATQNYADNPFSNYLETYVGPNTSTRQYDSNYASVEAVKNGECDAMITLSYIAEIFVWGDEKSELVSELISETTSDFVLGVNNNQDYRLLTVLNKCVSGLDRSNTSSIIAAEMAKFSPAYSSGLIAFLRRNPIYIVFIVTAVLVLAFVIILLVIRTVNQRKLKREIAEATSILEKQKEELSAALLAADAANRSKTTFLNNMSHDIRTPMNAIIGFTALATTHLDNRERALDYLTKISQASNHLLSLINDVLDMSRIESGKVHIEERPENLADILQGIRNIIQSDIHANRLELFIDTVDITNEEVYCDKLRINQILLNLTSNAIKFTKSGGSVFIKVTQRHCDKPGYGIYDFSVKDTGIGMSAEFAKTVFEPFTRERNSTVSGIQGTGLGMAITKNIVDMMKGTITVQSEQGIGTEFVVTLELKFADSEPENFSLAELNGLYSLVVDDDLISCQSVAKMLRQIGMHAEWTVTGKEAIVRTKEAIELNHPFEVYIVDWSMPDMDGIATVRHIRSIIGNDSPIILMSAYDWSDIEQDAKDAGVTGFISKPLFASDLHRALEKSLGKVQPKDNGDAQPAVDDIFKNKRILLVEDNELNREIAEELLSEAGFVVESAENGEIAYQTVLNSAPGYFDIILMDIQMPVLNGYDATVKIRAIENKQLADIPIIAMTANAFEEDKEKAFSVGMNGHLSKPINIDKVLALLKTFLSK